MRTPLLLKVMFKLINKHSCDYDGHFFYVNFIVAPCVLINVYVYQLMHIFISLREH